MGLISTFIEIVGFDPTKYSNRPPDWTLVYLVTMLGALVVGIIIANYVPKYKIKKVCLLLVASSIFCSFFMIAISENLFITMEDTKIFNQFTNNEEIKVIIIPFPGVGKKSQHWEKDSTKSRFATWVDFESESSANENIIGKYITIGLHLIFYFGLNFSLATFFILLARLRKFLIFPEHIVK